MNVLLIVALQDGRTLITESAEWNENKSPYDRPESSMLVANLGRRKLLAPKEVQFANKNQLDEVVLARRFL